MAGGSRGQEAHARASRRPLRRTTGMVAVLGLALLGSSLGGQDGSALGVAAPSTAPRPSDVVVREQLRGVPAPVAAVPAPRSDGLSAMVVEDGLDPTLVAAVRGLDGVIGATTAHTAMLGLLGSVDAAGAVRDALRPGMRIPVSVTAVDTASYLDVLPFAVTDADAALVRRLGPGEVILSARSAALRGIGRGARVDLGDARGLRVAGVVDDAVTRGNEFLVGLADLDTVDFGFGGRELLLVRHTGTSPVRAALDDTAAAVEGDDGEGARVWHGGRGAPMVLSTLEVKERFGEFAFRLVLDQREIVMDRAFVEEHIVEERMPVIGTVRCHRLIMDDLRAAVDELIAAGYEEWLSPRRYAGCYYPRRIGFGRENLSRHSWGIAIDLNVDLSLPGMGPVAPDELVAIMGRHGFRWGGDFSSPDNHHFEWVGEAALVRPERDGADDDGAGDRT